MDRFSPEFAEKSWRCSVILINGVSAVYVLTTGQENLGGFTPSFQTTGRTDASVL